jgi:hypothetical protein
LQNILGMATGITLVGVDGHVEGSRVDSQNPQL